MNSKTYDIQELTSETGVPRRTIYFYVQQGLLPPPQGAGLAAHYTEEHLLRLRLIPILRQQGLRLDGIREKLQGMSTDEMRGLARTADRPAAILDKPGVIVPPGVLPGWGEQRYTHYSLPGGITLTVPENINLTDHQRVKLLLQAARQIFSGPNPKYVYLNPGQTPDTPETESI